MSETFRVKPKLKPTSQKSNTPTPESKYWSSFKNPKQQDEETPSPPPSLGYPITSLDFSPAAPHHFAATHSATLTIFNAGTLTPKPAITSAFSSTATVASFRLDGRLVAAGDLSGAVHVFDAKSRAHLRRLNAHSAPTRVVCYPRAEDKLHLFSGGDDSVVKYWDVVGEKPVCELLGHKDYVRCGDCSPVSDDLFVSGGYDHRIRIWDVRTANNDEDGNNSKNLGCVMELDHGKPVESVIYLPYGGLIASAGGNVVKIWDLIGGGKVLYTMESHVKTVTGLCVGKYKRGNSVENGEESRLLSVSLDGYMKVFDYSRFKFTYSMRFQEPLLSIGFSPDCSTRVIGSSKGSLFIGKRKVKVDDGKDLGDRLGFGSFVEDVTEKQVLRPSYYSYFHRGQSHKPSEGDYIVERKKKVKLAKYDKLLNKFRHKDAFVAALSGKDPENVVAVMEELVARKKLLKSVSNLDIDELDLLLGFVQKYSSTPRYAGFLLRFANKVVELRADDIRSSDKLRHHVRNMKRDVEEELRIQQSLIEIQGIVSPLLRIATKI